MVLSAHFCQVYNLDVDTAPGLRSCLFELTVCCWFIIGPDRQRFQLGVFGISFPMRKLSYASVELPMKENVSGYSRNPCSLNRERDTAFTAKAPAKRVDGAVRQYDPDDVIASEMASHHQP